MRKIERIILHNSDSRFGTALLIRHWHVDERGFKDIGYHYVIGNGRAYHSDRYDQLLDGNIENGRDIAKVGAHVRGHNKYSIGVCMIGVDYFTPAQLFSTTKLIKYLMQQYNLSPDQVAGHYEFDNKKTCPNIDMNDFRKLLGTLS